MANPEHLAVLKQGVEAWNKWRQANPDIEPDLSKTALSRTNLGGVNLGGATLYKAYLYEANLDGANLGGANLHRATLYETNLSRAGLCKTDLYEANFDGANLHEANLHRALLRGANLRGAALQKADLSQADLREADLHEANLIRADLYWADLGGANLYRATLHEVNLYLANLDRANLSQADLYSANLYRANLHRALLRRANLHGTTLYEANLSQADLREADLSEANLNGANLDRVNLIGARLRETVLSNVRLIEIKDLDTCHHDGPSILDFRTLRQSSPLPLDFLRGCGLPDLLIDYLPSLLNRPIQYYSCFISYSSKDKDFAQRLHADLQNKDVRCWFAPKDIQGGRKIYEQISEQIRIHEKLLLILSKNSMNSEWVKTEIAEARQREKREKRQVLFPIRLVSFKTIQQWKCFDANTGKDSAREIQEYFILDFSNWRSHDAYQQSFNRLLRDLKPELERKPETP